MGHSIHHPIPDLNPPPAAASSAPHPPRTPSPGHIGTGDVRVGSGSEWGAGDGGQWEADLHQVVAESQERIQSPHSQLRNEQLPGQRAEVRQHTFRPQRGEWRDGRPAPRSTPRTLYTGVSKAACVSLSCKIFHVSSLDPRSGQDSSQYVDGICTAKRCHNGI